MAAMMKTALPGRRPVGVCRRAVGLAGVMLLAVAATLPAGPAGAQPAACQYSEDGDCDEPSILGSGLCPRGTDRSDCAAADAVAASVLAPDEVSRLIEFGRQVQEAEDIGGDIVEPLLRGLGLLQAAYDRGEADAADLFLAMLIRLNEEGSRRRDAGDYRTAIRLFERGAGLAATVYGADRPIVGRFLNNLGLVYQETGESAAAELVYRHGLAIVRNAHGAESEEVAVALDNLAGLRRVQGDLDAAARLYRQAIDILEATAGADSLQVSISLNNLAVVVQHQGNYPLARDLLQRVLSIRERTLGPDHRAVATVLNNLAALHGRLGEWAAAATLYERALAIVEGEGGPDTPDVATILDNLADAYHGRGDIDRALPLLMRALIIRRQMFGPGHPETARSLNNLAAHYDAIGAWDEAEALYRAALEVFEASLGPDHPSVATALVNLAIAEGRLDGAAAAPAPLERAVAIRQHSFGPDHPDTASGLADLAIAYDAIGEHERAGDAIGAARAGLQRWLSRLDADRMVAIAASPTPQDVLGDVLWLSGRWAGEAETDAERTRWVAESFDAAQLLRFTATSQSIARMAARFAAGDDGLARLVRDRQETAERLAALQAELVDLVSSGASGGGGDAIRRGIADLSGALATQDAAIARDFPAYAALARPQPLPLAEAQALLRPGEALVVFTVLAEVSYAWVVRPQGAVMAVLPVGEDELAGMVTLLRRWLDPAARPGVAGDDDPLAVAHGLYTSLWQPLEGALDGVGHVLAVPDGPLASLPLAVLVRTPADGAVAAGLTADRLRRTGWLIRDHAFTTLPAVDSLRALRRLAGGRTTEDRFIGFGDPVLAGGPPATPAAQPGRRGIATSHGLSQLPRLPETAEELLGIAASLEGWRTDLYLDTQATEARVKALSRSGALGAARILAFATHGLMSGELRGFDEPGLVLTPPADATDDDDGLLGASEIARLDLGAEWVVLSACNTAGPDGRPGAEGLSGLARAFFHAGARSLLVSHWAVYSEAAQALTTGTFHRLADDPALDRAEALRRTMLALIDGLPDPHPSYWAPFVVVGEGGTVGSAAGRD
ncbi:MAG: CHAT domain-containing protein [Rhodospirillaceae bacterium]|nr:CHAT domain-containing protein [Rhodospirillaceae bacterium]